MINAITRPLPNAVAVAAAMLRKLRVPVSMPALKQSLEDHPDFPSLFAISDCFRNWKVPHESYKISKDVLFDLASYPFIAHGTYSKFVMVENIKAGKVHYSNEHGRGQVMTTDAFLEFWDGVILYAEKVADSGESGYLPKQLGYRFRQVCIPLLIMILAAYVFRMPATPSLLALLMVKSAGLAICAILLLRATDKNNPLAVRFCDPDKQSGCTGILDTKAANVTTGLSWSEVGAFYFSGGLLALLTAPSVMSLLAWTNLLALPYTAYSLVYQARAKSWCVLCCMVQVLLLTECIIGVSGSLYTQPVFSMNAVLSFVLPVVLWYVMKPVLQKAVQLDPVKFQLKKFKYNQQLFGKVLKSELRYSIDEALCPLKLGNLQSANIVTMISNPFCAPCARAHELVEELLAARHDIQLNVIFSVPQVEGHPKTQVTRHLLALGQEENKPMVFSALNDWYKRFPVDYHKWAAQYPANIDREVCDIARRQRAWCEQAGIEFTPTVFVNGYKLPEPYSLGDVKYLLSEV